MPEVPNREVVFLWPVAADRETLVSEASERARAIEDTAGTLSDVYEPGELERLRQDWPE